MAGYYFSLQFLGKIKSSGALLGFLDHVDRLNHQYLTAIASHQTQTKPNNRISTKQSAIAIA